MTEVRARRMRYPWRWFGPAVILGCFIGGVLSKMPPPPGGLP